MSTKTACGECIQWSGLGVGVDIDVASMYGWNTGEVHGGRVLVFERINDAWIESTCLTIPVPPSSGTGAVTSVAVHGDRNAMAEPRYTAPGTGRVHIFERQGGAPGAWAHAATVFPSNGFPGNQGTDGFGDHLQLLGDVLLVAAPLASPLAHDPNRWHEGMVYRFRYANGQWSEVEQYWTSSAVGGFHSYRFGEQIHLSEDGVFASGPVDPGAGGLQSSCVYDYQRPIATTTCAGAPNSASPAGARLEVRGQRDHRWVALGFHGSRLPPGAATMLLASEQGAQVASPGGSQGTLCLGAPLARLGSSVAAASTTGTWVAALEPSDPGVSAALTVAAGRTWRFQAWYRDAHPAPTSNFTDAVAVSLR